MNRFFFIAFFLSLACHAQSVDSLAVSSDTVTIKSYASRYNPRRAILLAAILPGSGQFYTKKYWKIPLVLGGFYMSGFAISAYQNQQQKYREELFQFLSDQAKNSSVRTSKNGYTEDQLRNAIDRLRRERDFWILLSGLWYILQMVDAHVDAHLKEFNVNPHLKVSFEPSVKQDVWTGRTAGFQLTLKF